MMCIARCYIQCQNLPIHKKILLNVLFQMKYKLMNEELFILRSRDTIFVFKSAYEPNSEINKVC